jgi:hypothetical protein
MLYQALCGPSVKDTELIHQTKLTEEVEQLAESALRELAHTLKVRCVSLKSAVQLLTC